MTKKFVAKVKSPRPLRRICISLTVQELAIIKERANKSHGGNVSLYLRTMGIL
jgi:hypothetical protein